MTDEKTTQPQQHLAALKAAQTQQLESLSQMRSAALENARYWEDLSAAQGETAVSTPVPLPGPTTWVNAHFDYLDTIAKAQFEYAKALAAGSNTDQ